MGTPRLKAAPGAPRLSVIVLVYNEVESIPALHAELSEVLSKLDLSYEVLYIDDGSRDGSTEKMAQLAADDPHVQVVSFRRNFGQTAAVQAGIDHSRGEILVFMDGDLQNDPHDIPRLLEKLDEGYEVASGWRKNRQDDATRVLPSRIANWIIARVTGVGLHDFGCTLKAYHRDVIQDVKLYGEMHRFIPIYASWQGAKVTELVVNHRVRRAGRSKYGLSRTFKVVLDLMVVKFLASFATKPIYVFGGFGLFSFACAVAAFLVALYYKLAGLKSFVQTPLPLVTVMFTLVGALSLLMGLLAELVVRTYYESQGKRPYLVAEELNRPEKSLPRAVGQ
jgi:glycosyltransferase involved in cell wall biosynthesis